MLPEKFLYSKEDAAVALSLSLSSIKYLISKGELKTRRVGRRVLVPREELAKFSKRDYLGPIA